MTDTSAQILPLPSSTDRKIVLFENVDFIATGGKFWRIKRATMARKDSCGDLFLYAVQHNPHNNLENEHAFAGDLAEDPLAIAAVNKKLVELGYSGPRLGRAELGMQRENSFVMESPAEFLQFAHERFGWEYGVGMRAWLLENEASLFVRTFRSKTRVGFKSPDGARWDIGLDILAHAFTRVVAKTFKDKPEEGVAHLKASPLRGNAQGLLDWVREHAQEHWEYMRHYARQVEPPQPEDQMQAFRDGAHLSS